MTNQPNFSEIPIEGNTKFFLFDLTEHYVHIIILVYIIKLSQNTFLIFHKVQEIIKQLNHYTSKTGVGIKLRCKNSQPLISNTFTMHWVFLFCSTNLNILIVLQTHRG